MVSDLYCQSVLSHLFCGRSHFKIPGSVLTDGAFEVDVVDIGIRMLHNTAIEKLKCITGDGNKAIRQHHTGRMRIESQRQLFDLLPLYFIKLRCFQSFLDYIFNLCKRSLSQQMHRFHQNSADIALLPVLKIFIINIRPAG